MTITGIPVTVNLYQWITEYAASKLIWFDKNHSSHFLIKEFCLSDTFSFNGLSEDQKDIIYDFLRWLSIVVLSFDGGVTTANVRSFTINENELTIVWQNDLSYKVSLFDWSRSTRRAIDYIFDRACSVQNFSQNIVSSRSEIFLFLQYFLDQIKVNYEFSNQQLDFAKLDVFALDDSLIFTLLAGIPGNTLAGFYSNFSLLFSSDLSISVLNNTISLKQFFSRSCNDDLLLLDKVKMHYNLQLFSKLEPDLIQEMSNTTKEHLSLFLKDSQITDYVKNQINQVNELQLKPRIDLLTLLNDTFLKH